MTTAATIAAKLTLDASEFEGNLQGAARAADGFESKMKSVGQTMQKVGAAMTLALTVPIVAFMKASVESAAQSEAALADLNAVIESTGGVAGVSAEEVTKYADAMQLVTKFSDEEIISAQSMMLTFTKIGKEVFPMATDAALDMAQKFGMDATQAAIMLGKALNDPIAGVGALRRIGVQLSAEQENQIKKFMELNDVASAQKVILDELAVEVGGAAEAYGKTFGGQVAIFQNKLDTLKETLGTAIIPALIRFMDAITPIIEAIASAPPWVIDLVVAFLGLVALAGPLIGFIGSILSVVSSLSALGITGAAVGSVIAAFGSFLLALLPIIALIIAIVALVILVWKNWGQITTTLQQLWFLFVYAIKTGVSNIINYAKNTYAAFKASFSGIAKVIDWVISKVKALIAAIAKIALPPELTPGSPTPFEVGLRGIASAMDALSMRSLPKFNTGLSVTQAVTSVGGGGGTSIVDNSTYAPGLSAETLRMALDQKTKKWARAL